ncbi:type IV pilus biogenesis/stability protein PilW [Pseudomaricurvus sp.]|uniref:type IV pilus biogenesis/stability protein PilW n=1 Tax=Pseudomaricurvus sp. TaxID=2004510 RepID=UPI003F6D6FFB
MKMLSDTGFTTFLRKSVTVALIVLLAGCVTTTNSTQPKPDLDQAEKTHIQAGLGYLRQGDKKSARRHFQKALKINKSSEGAYNGLAYLYWMEGNTELAEENFEKALAIDPEFSQARNNYGTFLYSQQRYKAAEEQFEKVSQDYSYDNRYVGLLNLGRTKVQLGKPDEAVTALKQVVGINNQVAAPYLELADIYFEKKDYTVARHYLEQYGKRARQTPRSLWLGIRIERIFGNKDKEASYALALKNLHPYSPEYLEYKKSISE